MWLCPLEAAIAAGSDCWCLDGTLTNKRRKENVCGPLFETHPNNSEFYRSTDNCMAPFGSARGGSKGGGSKGGAGKSGGKGSGGKGGGRPKGKAGQGI